jgi:hypothetical protein
MSGLKYAEEIIQITIKIYFEKDSPWLASSTLSEESAV